LCENLNATLFTIKDNQTKNFLKRSGVITSECFAKYFEASSKCTNYIAVTGWCYNKGIVIIVTAQTANTQIIFFNMLIRLKKAKQ